MSDRAANRSRPVDKTVKSRPEASYDPTIAREFFRPPDRDFTRALEAYRDVLHAVHPLRPKHRAALPVDVKRLSESLTSERGQGPRPNYLADPSNLSAYLSYFLPWNLLRLGLLFTGLELDLPDGARILDLGAGPLTVAQALWMSRPDLRDRRLSFVCLDQTGSVLRVGRALFDALAGEAGRAWSFELAQGPLHKAPAGPFDLVTAANCLNEAGGGRGQEGRQGLVRAAELMVRRLAPGGRVLLAEPGTRLGGGLLGRMREELLELDMHSLAPCTHDEPCPMLAPRRRSWCHFTAQAYGSPTWLGKLSHAAGLPKDRLSLSFLFMGEEPPRREERFARVVSSSFALPVGGAVYGCCDQGLAVLAFLRRPQGLESGALARLPEELGDERDPKTGALIVPLDRNFPRERQPEGLEGTDARGTPLGPRSDDDPGRKHGARGDARGRGADQRGQETDAPRGRGEPKTGRTASGSSDFDAPRGRGESRERDFRRGANGPKAPRGREATGDRAFGRGRDEPVRRDRSNGPNRPNRPDDPNGPAGARRPDRRHGPDGRGGPDGSGRSDGRGGPNGPDRADKPNRPNNRSERSDRPDRHDGPRPNTGSGPGDRDKSQRPFARPKRRPVSGQGRPEVGAARHRSGQGRSESDADRRRDGRGDRESGDS